MAGRKKSTPMKVRTVVVWKNVWRQSGGPQPQRAASALRAASDAPPPLRPLPNPLIPPHPTIIQRLKHVATLGYTYLRPMAYFGMIPFVLYVGMNGDAAPSWVDFPRYLIAVL